MDRRITEILNKYGMDLNLETEAQILEEIKKKNSENEVENANLRGQRASDERELRALIARKPEIGQRLDLDRIDDKQYLEDFIKEEYVLFEARRKEFDEKSTKCLNELRGDR